MPGWHNGTALVLRTSFLTDIPVRFRVRAFYHLGIFMRCMRFTHRNTYQITINDFGAKM